MYCSPTEPELLQPPPQMENPEYLRRAPIFWLPFLEGIVHTGPKRSSSTSLDTRPGEASGQRQSPVPGTTSTSRRQGPYPTSEQTPGHQSILETAGGAAATHTFLSVECY